MMETQKTAALPETQHAVQLVGPDKLVLNKRKKVFAPCEHQILCKVEAVGLCFSDLKLLKQFSSHVRKGEILSGIDSEVLKDIPSYVPNETPAVPGHEAVVRVAAVGPGVDRFKPGQRCLVQTDYRWLRTASSNASFGYNFEGALQEYVLMDERIIISPQGDSLLIPVSEELSASAVALIEPWACVEDAYAVRERRRLKPNGRMLIVADTEVTNGVFASLFNHYGRPAQLTWVSKFLVPAGIDVVITRPPDMSKLSDAGYDDVIYFGAEARVVETLFAKIAPQGLLNIVLCGRRFGRNVVTAAGRVHYAGIRIVGTSGQDPTESMKYIPETGEIRTGDKINVIGAAGPMGTMNVIRNICQQVEGISVFAGDVDENRLAALSGVAEPLSKRNNVKYKPYNPKKQKIAEAFDYIVLMVPVPELVAASVKSAATNGIINIFAGIPATITAKIDLNTYIEKRLYFIGTSGSILEDMERVLAKVEAGNLDTNVSVAAVCGLDGASEGIRAVENRQIAGKIIVYPACKGLKLTELPRLKEKMPEIAQCLRDGMWNRRAEQALMKRYGKS
ncbi:MAG: alcohol dehydrogenase catalytic domain-containing protein [Planctomycetota bacterium]|nr:MAG: alcohol dehydrogenase catalytic domain-containing protein [Planctomycetota bacterium]